MAAAQMLPPPPKAKAPATKAKIGEALRLGFENPKGPDVKSAWSCYICLSIQSNLIQSNLIYFNLMQSNPI